VSHIDHAQPYIHVECFMFAEEPVGAWMIDALIRACQRDVACFLLGYRVI
jgi:phosphatidylserine/phosphatidylglycerophosphate/cardiolipin synthase-like enzyme